ncbi:tetraacyldisaccharide 4'-kinase [Glaciecola sp. SC05]|uniref:tetraacyldisaccharide 4'-kinase n=1 Tax=Glaciecola sp. SC05 TaxID=1987355 RepID=UPI0035273771
MRLHQAWYAKRSQQPIWIYLLAPLSLLFWLISRTRAALYRCKILERYKSKLPVIVVGNISVGGNGKTPVVLALLTYFGQQGIKCAVLSRGYGAQQQQFPHLLALNSDPLQVGDEPALIRNRANVPVVIDPKRARGAKFIEQNTDAQLIVCDDGMQHYALDRDFELCVMDKRGIGNGYLMPMGPLRESAKRLNSVQWLIYNGTDTKQHDCLASIQAQTALMSLEAMAWVNVKNGQILSLEAGVVLFSKAQSIAAIAGIGDPKRFFDTLGDFNLALSDTKAMPDHHAIVYEDVPNADIVLMTEKDAVKCKEFALENYWYLQVEARLPDGFYRDLQQSLSTYFELKNFTTK